MILYSLKYSTYRFGFNGQEKDDEVFGSTGTSYTAEFWQYDSRLGRRWNVDPIVKEWESSYAAFANNPIWFADPLGSDTIDVTSGVYDANGKAEGEDGFDSNNMLKLFTTFVDNETDNRYSMTARNFYSKYQTTGADNVTGIYNGSYVTRDYAKILNVNNNSSYFNLAVTNVNFTWLNKKRNLAISLIGSEWYKQDLLIKLDYFSQGKSGDIKKGLKYLVFISGVGIMERDYLGNVFYGSVWSGFQSLENSIWDGNELQTGWSINGTNVRFGLDDPFDSKAIMAGHLFGQNGINKSTFQKINSTEIIIRSQSISNAIYHDYTIELKNKNINFKSKSFY